MTIERTAQIMRDTTAAIVAAIESGAANPAQWSAPWHHANPADLMPTNPVTARDYTGGNRVVLYFLALDRGVSGQWATYEQWKTLDAQVRKGERGSYILRPMSRKVELANGDEAFHTFGFKPYTVFSASQVDGYTPAVVEPAPAPLPDDDRADADAAFRWAATMGVRVEESPTAGGSYSPQLDRVMMPDRDRFTSSHGVWSTLAHECTHWTGHETRLARTFGKRFGDHAYAAEELCAELGAAFTLAGLGRSTEPREDHAQYLASWLQVLGSAPDALWTVASKAQAASEYLAGRAVALDRTAA